MTKAIENILKPFLKNDLPNIRPGDTVRVHQKIKEMVESAKSKKGQKEEKERTQVFEGVVLARKHGKGISSTMTVRRIVAGVGVERIFPLHLPTIEKIEIVSHSKVRRAKLYYMRKRTGKKARLKHKAKFEKLAVEEKSKKEEK